MKSSCRAPALSAIAFHPFCVGTVTRILTFPRASRTGRMTPGMIERIAAFADRISSRISRTAIDDAVLDLEPVLGRAQAH